MKKDGMVKGGLLLQIAFVFIVGTALTTLLSYFSLMEIADSNVSRENTRMSRVIAGELRSMFEDYAAYEWVVGYLIEHCEDLEPEYDTDTETAVREVDFCKRYDLRLKEVTEEQLEQMPEEDRRAFAEMVFNHWLLRMNDMKKAYDLVFLYFVAMEPDYKTSVTIISAKDEGQVRGYEDGKAFPMGLRLNHTDAQYAALINVEDGNDHRVSSDMFADYYNYLFNSGDKLIVSGITFDIRDITSEVRARSLGSLVLFSCLQIALSAFALLLINKYVLSPLDTVKGAVTEYAASKDGTVVRKILDNITVRNEIRLLSNEFSGMIGELEDHIEQIKTISEERERIGAELDIATEIQANMLPGNFNVYSDHPEFALHASMDPAKEVGGDFYDFFMPDEDHIALVIADVSGKGIPAALFMVIAKTLIKNRTLMGGTPSQILSDVNDQICETNASGFFVTVWLAIVDIHTGKGMASNAGHEHPVLKRAGGQYELIKYRHSLAVAAMEGVPFEEHSFELHPGDRIFVYTDGVPEATNMSEELYGTDRMLEALNRVTSPEPEKLLSELTKDISNFVGEAEQFDDTTMLIFEYRGTDTEKEIDKSGE
ncbi:MAG: PP2C family protein-serine/threonine phosphatase [Lachnospiraceae bacterium]|nr:PP2C family protein-serine/threonine phosphatase [Lachnospiraceae bacterium]